MVTDVGGKLHVATAISVSGKGGFRGDLPRALSLSAKNFNAAANVSADVDLQLNPNWCPSVNVRVSYNWTQNPRVEIISRTWVDVSGQANNNVDRALAGLQDKIAAAIPCDRIKAEASKAWHAYDVPLAIPGEPPLHLLVVPTAVGTSGVIINASEVRIAVGIRARTEISSQPGPSADTPLPPLGTVPDAAGRLAIDLPIHARYETIAGAINDALKGNTFDFAAAGQSGNVSIHGVSVYPSNGDLAIAFDFLAHFASHVPDVSGKIYATAKPLVGADALSIGITDFTYRAALNSALWSALSFAFKGEIQRSVERNAKIDLTQRVSDIMGKLQAGLSDPAKTRGVKIEVGSPTVRIKSIIPEKDTLTAVLDAAATLDTTVTDIALTQ